MWVTVWYRTRYGTDFQIVSLMSSFSSSLLTEPWFVIVEHSDEWTSAHLWTEGATWLDLANEMSTEVVGCRVVDTGSCHPDLFSGYSLLLQHPRGLGVNSLRLCSPSGMASTLEGPLAQGHGLPWVVHNQWSVREYSLGISIQWGQLWRAIVAVMLLKESAKAVVGPALRSHLSHVTVLLVQVPSTSFHRVNSSVIP